MALQISAQENLEHNWGPDGVVIRAQRHTSSSRQRDQRRVDMTCRVHYSRQRAYTIFRSLLLLGSLCVTGCSSDDHSTSGAPEGTCATADTGSEATGNGARSAAGLSGEETIGAQQTQRNTAAAESSGVGGSGEAPSSGDLAGKTDGVEESDGFTGGTGGVPSGNAAGGDGAALAGNAGGTMNSAGEAPEAAGAGGMGMPANGGDATLNDGGLDETGGAVSELNAAQMVNALGIGTNIGNTLENTSMWETGWGQPLITQAYVNGLADHGFKTVRVPVAWDTYASNGVVDPANLKRVQEVVGWIEAAGMYSIVNIHWDGGWIFNEGGDNAYLLTQDVKDKFASYWRQIASALSSAGHQLIFEGLNEEGRFYTNGDPDQTPDYAALNELNQLFVTTVRAQAGYNQTRALLIAGFQTDIALTCVDEFQVPNDPAGAGKLFLSIHYYSPYPFTLMDSVESWGSPSTTWGTDEEVAALTADFDTLGACSNNKDIPVILGEFAVTTGQSFVRESASRTRWMRAVISASFERNIVPVLWDTGSDVNRSDGSLSIELQDALQGL